MTVTSAATSRLPTMQRVPTMQRGASRTVAVPAGSDAELIYFTHQYTRLGTLGRRHIELLLPIILQYWTWALYRTFLLVTSPFNPLNPLITIGLTHEVWKYSQWISNESMTIILQCIFKRYQNVRMNVKSVYIIAYTYITVTIHVIICVRGCML